QHGFQTHSKAYHFFKNLYDYEQKPALLIGRHKLDATTGQPPRPQSAHFSSL
ncbi:18469_t:CDS:1, partial [Racocetra persica]